MRTYKSKQQLKHQLNTYRKQVVILLHLHDLTIFQILTLDLKNSNSQDQGF